ncbi:MAG TPA: hypothetical protein VLJ68_02095, partial [Chitinophagaceae bacterium]|nr:hypothetical protein [Chitinophagaceae bacterium]
MKKYAGHIVIILNLFLLSTSYTSKKNYRRNAEGISRWTGTLRMEVRYTGITGTSERTVTVSFLDALPTLNREDGIVDLNFTDDKGTGSALYHGDAIIAGKKISTTDCQGSGPSELHEVVVDETEGTYRIHAIGPSCSGTTVSLLDGTTSPYGPEFSDIIVSDQPLGSNKNLLSGSKTETSDLLGMGTSTTLITWNLSRTTTSAELIVTPDNYDGWIPEPGPNEFTKGSTIKISLKLHGRNGQPPTVKAKSFELRLSNTSNEPGMTLNFPLTPSDPFPDLRFMPGASAGVGADFQSATINCQDGINGEITIAAYDGGGYTMLTAVAILRDNTRLDGHLLISGGNTEIPIPKRPNGSNIAEAWLNAHNNPGDMDDKETSTGNSNNGDGLTAYEEYRGVWSEGKYKRLDPDDKELGVWVKKSELPLFSLGLDWLENASNIKVIKFIDNEIGPDRQLNKHFKTSHDYDQYALKLLKQHIRKDVLGRTEPGPGTPKTVTRIKIDYDQIVSHYIDYQRQAILNNFTLPFSESDFVAKTVAHELGHGMTIRHHGESELVERHFVIHPGPLVH